jgi:hypothetical protein
VHFSRDGLFCLPRGILLMWDKCVVECIEAVVGTFSISCKFKSYWTSLFGIFWEFSGFSVGEKFLFALGETSMLLASQMKGWNNSVNLCHEGIFRFHFKAMVDGYSVRRRFSLGLITKTCPGL